MSKRAAILLAVSSAVLSSAVALAADAAGHLKAGLWEITTQSSAMQNMKIPPAQIEQMRRLGVDISKFQGGAIVSKVCITPEMAARDALPQMAQQRRDCTVGAPQAETDGYVAGVTCHGPTVHGKGKWKVVYSGDESFSASSEFTGDAAGRPLSDHSVTSGKWLDAHCGTVKPAAGMQAPQ